MIVGLYPHLPANDVTGDIQLRFNSSNPCSTRKIQHNILQRLAGGEHTIAQLTEHFDMTRASIKKHLTVLSHGGLITTRVSGRERFSAFDPNGFAPMRDWISIFDQFWDNQLTNLIGSMENNDQ